MEDRLNENGVRIRRDGKGSPFGELHRNYFDPDLKLTDVDYTQLSVRSFRMIDTSDETFFEYQMKGGRSRVCAIIEHAINDGKSDRWLKKLNLSDSEPGAQAYSDVASRLNIPFIIVVYATETDQYTAHRIYQSGHREDIVLVKDRHEIMRQWNHLCDRKTRNMFEE